MAWPALLAVAKAVPWVALVQQAPAILDAANKLRTHAEPKPELAEDERSGEADIDALHAELAELRERDRETAEVIRQLARQNQEMATSIQALAAKTRALGYGLLAAVVVALAAVAFPLF